MCTLESELESLGISKQMIQIFMLPWKKKYRKLEQEPLITLLRSAPNPKPTHDNMMQILVKSLQV